VRTGAGGADVGHLPSGAAVSELFTDPPHIDLHPLEAAVVARAVDKRRRECAAVRLCARTALRRIGVPRTDPAGPQGCTAVAGRSDRQHDAL